MTRGNNLYNSYSVMGSDMRYKKWKMNGNLNCYDRASINSNF